ncbi:MAG TPA: CAP domain-containing protein [Burkholderiales bacterium]|nr:CAP domain-containing protein [Burkholderiales bacterium]
MISDDIRAITSYHNKVRADVGVGPLQWSGDLAGYAQQWASHLAATTCSMAHRTQQKYGENLFQGTAGYYPAVDADKAWENEKKKLLRRHPDRSELATGGALHANGMARHDDFGLRPVDMRPNCHRGLQLCTARQLPWSSALLSPVTPAFALRHTARCRIQPHRVQAKTKGERNAEL